MITKHSQEDHLLYSMVRFHSVAARWGCGGSVRRGGGCCAAGGGATRGVASCGDANRGDATRGDANRGYGTCGGASRMLLVHSFV